MTTFHKSNVRDMLVCSFLGAWSVAGNKKPITEPIATGLYCHEKYHGVVDGLVSPETVLEDEQDDERWEILNTTFASDPYLRTQSHNEIYIAINEAGEFIPAAGRSEEDINPWIAGTLDRLFLPGSIQALPDTMIAMDYKTGRVVATFRAEIVFYLLLGWALCRAIDREPKHGRFIYFYGRTGKREIFNEQRSFSQLLEEARQITELCETLLENPVPTPGHHCSWCHLLTSECPLYAGLPAVSDPTVGKLLDEFVATGNLESSLAPKVGFALHALEAKTSELKKALQAWSAEHGPIPVGDAEWGLHLGDGDTWDQEASHAILAQDWVPDEARRIAYGISTNRVKKLRKPYPDLHKQLYRFARIPGRPRETFKYSKR